MLTGTKTDSEHERARTKRPSAPDPSGEHGAGPRHVARRVCALAALVGLTVLSVGELSELRGELAFARFWLAERMAGKSGRQAEFDRTVQGAFAEGELVMLFARANPDALWEVTGACGRWAGDDRLDPLFRLRLGEQAVRAAVLAVRAAPSDYEPWLSLARSQAAIGLWEQARRCLARAQDLAPPGMELRLFRRAAEKDAAARGDQSPSKGKGQA